MRRSFATRSPVIARNGIAATSHPLATQIALDILKQGGTAMDAAIAANAALSLMEPMMCGIGGDLFAIVWLEKEQKLYGLNASGRSPYGLTLEKFKKRGTITIPDTSELSVTVPGAVDGWFELHERFGKLPMAKILAPTIEYARVGFPVTQVTSADWWYVWPSFIVKPNFATTFMLNGWVPKEGEIYCNPDLANTLEVIASEGRDAFYKGNIAQVIDAFSKRVGVDLRYRDLAEHTSTWVKPISVNYRGYDVWELPPNGQGTAVLQMLNILEGFNLRAMGHNSTLYLHHLIEAKKIAYEDRARFYADPDFNDLPLNQLLSKKYAEQRRSLLDPNLASRKFLAGDPQLINGDTTYLTVADKDRNMVSLIQSLYGAFGSGIVPDGLGFALQNRGSGFSLEEEHFNVYAPHKRPFHTIIPAFITKDGKPHMSFGVMGGDMQPQGHVQVILNLIDFGMNVQESGDALRFRHVGASQPYGGVMTDGGTVWVEPGIRTEVQRELVKKGHDVQPQFDGYGGYQAILYDRQNNVYRSASESRKDGMAAGY